MAKAAYETSVCALADRVHTANAQSQTMQAVHNAAPQPTKKKETMHRLDQETGLEMQCTLSMCVCCAGQLVCDLVHWCPMHSVPLLAPS